MTALDSEVVERAGAHVSRSEADGVNIKSELMEFAALEREFTVERLSNRMILVDSPQGRIGFHSMNGPRSSHIGRMACDNKDITHTLLSTSGLPVARSRAFATSEGEEAWEFAESIGTPVVVKPSSLARGRGVTTDVGTKAALGDALESVRRAYPPGRTVRRALVEEQVSGNDYRLFVVDGAVVAATLRRRARVRGDGRRTVLQLIERKNRRREQNPYLGQHLIPTDLPSLDRLRAQSLDLDHVPAKDELLTLRSASNLSSGGDSVDVTDRIHDSYKRLATEAVRAVPGMTYAGVDLIVHSIHEEATASNVVVSEVEFSPAPLTYFPWYGESRDMAGPILEYYISADKPGLMERIRAGRRRSR